MNCPFKFSMNMEWYRELSNYGIEFKLLICDEENCKAYNKNHNTCKLIKDD